MNEAAAFAHFEEQVAMADDDPVDMSTGEIIVQESRMASALAIIATGRVSRRDLDHIMAAAHLDILGSVPFVLGVNRMTVIVKSTVYAWQFLPFYGEMDWAGHGHQDYSVWCVSQLHWSYYWAVERDFGDLDLTELRFKFPKFYGRRDVYRTISRMVKEKKPDQIFFDPDTHRPHFPCHFSPPNRGNQFINMLPIRDNMVITRLPYRLFFDLCRDLMHIAEILHNDLWEKMFEGNFDELDYGTFFGGLLLMSRSTEDKTLMVESHAKKAWLYIIKVIRHIAFNVENVFDNCGSLVPYLCSFALHWIPGGLITLDHYNSLHNDSSTGLVETASLESDANCKWMLRSIVRWLDEPVPRVVPGQVVACGLHPMVPMPRNRQTPVVRPANAVVDDFNDDIDFEAVFEDERHLDNLKFETDQQYLFYDEEGWLIFPQLADLAEHIVEI